MTCVTEPASTVLLIGAGTAAVGVMTFLDLTWIGLNVRYGVYKGRVDVQRPRWQVALLWGAVLIVLAALATSVAYRHPTVGTATVNAAILGAIVYFVFNATALVAFGTQWTWTAAVIDTAWGGILLAVGALVAALVLHQSKSPSRVFGSRDMGSTN
jgi:uncharacterized membrane protein